MVVADCADEADLDVMFVQLTVHCARWEPDLDVVEVVFFELAVGAFRSVCMSKQTRFWAAAAIHRDGRVVCFAAGASCERACNQRLAPLRHAVCDGYEVHDQAAGNGDGARGHGDFLFLLGWRNSVLACSCTVVMLYVHCG